MCQTRDQRPGPALHTAGMTVCQQWATQCYQSVLMITTAAQQVFATMTWPYYHGKPLSCWGWFLWEPVYCRRQSWLIPAGSHYLHLLGSSFHAMSASSWGRFLWEPVYRRHRSCWGWFFWELVYCGHQNWQISSRVLLATHGRSYCGMSVSYCWKGGLSQRSAEGCGLELMIQI